MPLTVQSQINISKYSSNLSSNKLLYMQVICLILYAVIITAFIDVFGQGLVDKLFGNGVEIGGVVIMSIWLCLQPCKCCPHVFIYVASF